MKQNGLYIPLTQRLASSMMQGQNFSVLEGIMTDNQQTGQGGPAEAPAGEASATPKESAAVQTPSAPVVPSASPRASAPAEPVAAEPTPAEQPKPTETEAAPTEAPAEAPATEAAEAAPASTEPAEKKEEIRAGYKVRIAQKIMQGGKERVQNFEGVVIATAGKTPETKTITVRKISEGTGVEKIFPLAAPTIVSIDILDRMKVRRSKLYFLRESLQKFQKLRKKK